MPTTATLASRLLILLRRLCITRVPFRRSLSLGSWAVRQVARDDTPRIVGKQPDHAIGTDPLLEPGDPGRREADVGRGVTVRGHRVGEAVLAQAARQLGLRPAVRAVEGPEIDDQRAGLGQLLDPV